MNRLVLPLLCLCAFLQRACFASPASLPLHGPNLRANTQITAENVHCGGETNLPRDLDCRLFSTATSENYFNGDHNDGDDGKHIRVPFDAPAGKEMLISSNTQLGDFYALMENFVTQDTQSYCAVASGTMVLNSMGNEVLDRIVPDPIYQPYHYLTQNMFLDDKCVIKTLGQMRLFIFMGLTLSQLAESMQCFGVEVEKVYFSDHIKSSEGEGLKVLQDKMMDAIDDGKFVIANVDRPELAEVGGGHFSPIGAYYRFAESAEEERQSKPKEFENSSGMFLFMDVSRYKYKPMWVDGESLITAMKKEDLLAQKSRGFLIVSVPEERLPMKQVMPAIDVIEQ